MCCYWATPCELQILRLDQEPDWQLKMSSVVVEALEGNDTVPAALKEFEKMHRPLMERVQHIVFESMCWFQNIQDNTYLGIVSLMYELVTRSKYPGEALIQVKGSRVC